MSSGTWLSHLDLGHPIGQFLVNFNSDAVHVALVSSILFAWSNFNQFIVSRALLMGT
jgi:hypothetical protein